MCLVLHDLHKESMFLLETTMRRVSHDLRWIFYSGTVAIGCDERKTEFGKICGIAGNIFFFLLTDFIIIVVNFIRILHQSIQVSTQMVA